MGDMMGRPPAPTWSATTYGRNGEPRSTSSLWQRNFYPAAVYCAPGFFDLAA